MDLGAGTNKGISPVPIVLKVFSPNVVNLSLIDLPGITKIPVGDQPDDIEKRIKQMINIYTSNPNSLVLAISPANNDIANSDSLKLARQVDPDGERTLGVVTKMDTGDDEAQILKIISGEVYPLKLGYVGVRCRNQEETERRKPMREAIIDEAQFFGSHPSYKNFSKRMGIPYLTQRLNEYLVHHVKRCVPLIRQKLNSMINEKQKEVGNYGILSNFSESNNSRGALLISLINKYSKYYIETLRGNFFIDKELCGGAKINTLFDNYNHKIMQLKPFENMNDKDFSISVRNVCGLNHSLVISDKAFEVLVKKEIERLREPSFECLNFVFQELKNITTKIRLPELDIMEKARSSMIDTMIKILDSCFEPTQSMLENIFRIETGYINTRHPEFIRERERLFCKN